MEQGLRTSHRAQQAAQRLPPTPTQKAAGVHPEGSLLPLSPDTHSPLSTQSRVPRRQLHAPTPMQNILQGLPEAQLQNPHVCSPHQRADSASNSRALGPNGHGPTPA